MNKIGLNKNSATSVEHKLKLIENELLKEQNSILRLSSSLYSIKVSNKSEIDRTRQVLKSMLNSIQRDLHMIRTFKARYHKFIRDIINYDKKMAMQINKYYNTYYNTKKLGHLKIENNYKVLSYNELGRAYSELQDEKEGGIFSFNDIRERAILNQYPSYMKYNYLLHYDTINSDNKLNYYWGKIKYTGKGLYARTFGILESEEENFLRAQGFNEYYSKLGAGIVSGECGFGMIASSIRSVGVLKNYKCLKQGTISFMGSGELSKVGKDTVEVEKAAKALEQTKGPKDIGNAAKGVGNPNSIPDKFYKYNGGMDKADTISIHAEKYLYNPEVISTKKKTQFGKDIDILKLREDTMLHPDSIVYNDEQNVIKYVKEYDFNISTPDTPTGQHRVFINLSPKAGKTNRNSQFSLYTGGN